jgi:colicin import membrane protein
MASDNNSRIELDNSDNVVMPAEAVAKQAVAAATEAVVAAKEAVVAAKEAAVAAAKEAAVADAAKKAADEVASVDKAYADYAVDDAVKAAKNAVYATYAANEANNASVEANAEVDIKQITYAMKINAQEAKKLQSDLNSAKSKLLNEPSCSSFLSKLFGFKKS